MITYKGKSHEILNNFSDKSFIGKKKNFKKKTRKNTRKKLRSMKRIKKMKSRRRIKTRNIMKGGEASTLRISNYDIDSEGKDNILKLTETEYLIFYDKSNEQHSTELYKLKEHTPGLNELFVELNKYDYCVLLISGDTIEGYVIVVNGSDGYTLFENITEPVVSITFIKIYEKLQGRGYCRRMVKYMLENLKLLGIHYIAMEEDSENKMAACKCYYKSGKEVGFKVRIKYKKLDNLLRIANELKIEDPSSYSKQGLRKMIEEKSDWKHLAYEINSDDGCNVEGIEGSHYYHYTLD
jgi:ribosomal protein S18 acetylase RimI-like enzyme